MVAFTTKYGIKKMQISLNKDEHRTTLHVSIPLWVSATAESRVLFYHTVIMTVKVTKIKNYSNNKRFDNIFIRSINKSTAYSTREK